jgi:signal transduction histidine kinase/ligand-binding sensor domain-containing protein
MEASLPCLVAMKLAARLAALVSCCPFAYASAQSFDLRQYAHTAWTVQDGAPGAVRNLAQGVDGVLWIASERGLFQFDGVRFERFEPPPGQALLPYGAHILLPLPDTALWIGHFTTGVSVLHRGTIVTYGTQDGLPGGTVTSIARDSGGTVWASTTRGLARLNGRRWEEIGPDAGYPGGFTEPVLVDRRGSVWALSQDGIYVLARGATRFEKRDVTEPGGRGTRAHWIASAPDGSIWGVKRPYGLFRVADTQGNAPSDAAVAYADTLPFGVTFARGHPAVLTSMTGRLVVLSLPDSTRPPALGTLAGTPNEIPFSRTAGMSGDRVMAALYDREGTLWVGTPAGLDRFRRTKLTPIAWPGQINWPAVAADTNGTVWVAARNASPSTLFAIGDRVVPRLPSASTLTSIYRDLRGTIWIGGEPGLWERKGNALVPVPLPVPVVARSPSRQQVHAIARDRDDGLWVAIVNDGVYHRRVGADWQRFAASRELSGAVANVITTDSSGRTWLGYATGQVALVMEDSVRILGASDGINVGSVLAISVRGNRVWVAGQFGVAALAEREAERGGYAPFVMLATAGEPLRGVSGVVETADGDLWLNGADGVTHILAADVRRALTEPKYSAQYERLDYRDGIEPPAPQIRPLPSAIAGTDGRIWFTSASGVSWVDPNDIRRNSVAPSVQLREVVAGGRRYVVGASSDSVRLPPRTTPLSVAYTAFSMAVPERVRFRYRLEGLDTAWQDAGGRREAFYTNLPPGSYRFHVIAANEDGVWNTAGASLPFTIDPAWDQTWWFFALVVGAIAAAAAGSAGAWQLRRSRLAAERSQARFDTILAERTRVARELHDTLLGDMAGVAMQLSAGARRAEASGGADATIVQLLTALSTQVQRSLVDARRSVTALRTVPEELPPLHEQLAEAVTRTFAGTGVAAHVERMGEPRPYPPTVEAEIVGIITEAMMNARQHARCATVVVTCSYAPRALHVRVRDDGHGFDPSGDTPPGHWGLVGMRERASSIGAKLTVTSDSKAGTDVVLVVPGGPGRWTWWNRSVPSTPS